MLYTNVRVSLHTDLIHIVELLSMSLYILFYVPFKSNTQVRVLYNF